MAPVVDDDVHEHDRHDVTESVPDKRRRAFIRGEHHEDVTSFSGTCGSFLSWVHVPAGAALSVVRSKGRRVRKIRVQRSGCGTMVAESLASATPSGRVRHGDYIPAGGNNSLSTRGNESAAAASVDLSLIH